MRGDKDGQKFPSGRTSIRTVVKQSIGSPGLSLGIASLLAVLLAVFVWPFDDQYGLGWYPGAIALFVVAGLLFAFAPWKARLSASVLIAISSLVLLGLWTFISMAWSPAPDIAFADGELTFLYLAIFIIGLWLAHLRKERVNDLLAPLVITGAVVAIATTVVLASGTDIGLYLTPDSTLRFPIGSRSSNAAFFLILFWPTLILAGKRSLDWRLRAPLLGTATLMLGLAVLCHSRASVVATVVAAIAYIALSRERLRATIFLALAAIPVAVALPWLLDIFAEGSRGDVTVSILHSTTRVLAVSAVAAVGLGAFAHLVETRLDSLPTVHRWSTRVAVATIALLVVLGSAAFIRAEGDPIQWIEERYKEFKRGGDPTFSDRGTRFTADATTNRSDAWRVALHAARSDPLIGTGAGGFLFYDLRERRSGTALKDPHNVGLAFLSELGIPGLLLFFVFATAAAVGVARSRRGHSAADTITLVALVVFTYWLVQALIDPLWSRPTVTAPVIGILGMAAAPALLGKETPRRLIYRIVPAVLALLLAAVAIPAYQSDHLTSNAYKLWDEDRALDAAYHDLDRAKKLNPLSDAPLIAEGLIARSAGDTETAIEAFHEAIDLNPDYWLPHERYSRLIRRSKPVLALKEQETALRLNPKNKKVRQDLFLLYLKNADRVRSHSAQRAYRYAEKAHEMMPDHVAPIMTEGFIALHDNDRKRALKAFREAAEIDPDFWQPHFEIGQLLKTANPVESERELKLARELKRRSDQDRKSK